MFSKNKKQAIIEKSLKFLGTDRDVKVFDTGDVIASPEGSGDEMFDPFTFQKTYKLADLPTCKAYWSETFEAKEYDINDFEFDELDDDFKDVTRNHLRDVLDKELEKNE